jgi:hypothetical protein
MSGRVCVVVGCGLLEDILEVTEGLDGGFAHVGGHSIVKCLCKRPCCLDNPVFRGDCGICQIFVFEESCARDVGCARGYRPELPTPIVFGQGVKDKCFSAVLSKQAALVGFVVDKGPHAYGD